jgi:hypothetical protein
MKKLTYFFENPFKTKSHALEYVEQIISLTGEILSKKLFVKLYGENYRIYTHKTIHVGDFAISKNKVVFEIFDEYRDILKQAHNFLKELEQ